MYRKSRKNLIIFKKKKTLKKNKSNQGITSSKKNTPLNAYEQVLDAIMLFNYKTDSEQIFKSEAEKQKHLATSTKVLRDSVDKYIQTRSTQF
jgi:hypothetical protein